jgi:hypothetical protein
LQYQKKKFRDVLERSAERNLCMLTVEDIRAALPDHLKSAANQDLADTVNQISSDPEAAAAIRETFIGYAHVLNEKRFKLQDFVNAAAFVSYRLMGFNNQESYARTFPQRYQALVAKGTSNKDISSYVAMYSKNKLVNQILSQALIPSHVFNHDIFQKAIMEQAYLMSNAKSEMVRMQAANSLLTHLKPPEKKEVELSISTGENSGLGALRDLLTAVAERQQQLIKDGASTKEIAHQKVVMSSAMIDVTPEEQ